MPLLRKVIKIGSGKAVVLPKDWLDYWERRLGHEIREVEVEVNGHIVIRPATNKEGNNNE